MSSTSESWNSSSASPAMVSPMKPWQMALKRSPPGPPYNYTACNQSSRPSAATRPLAKQAVSR